MVETKHQLRRRMRSVRDGLTPDEVALGSAAIGDRLLALDPVLQANCVFVYVSFRSEVATRALIDALLARGTSVLVPRVIDGERMEAAAFNAWGDMTPDSFGVLTPSGTAIDEREIDVCLAPGLAFTWQGDRLGYGKGHYDRFLARRSPERLIGLAFECQVVDAISVESFDRRMDLVVTEQRVMDCAEVRG